MGAGTSGSHSIQVPRPWAAQQGPAPQASIPVASPWGPREGEPLSSGWAVGETGREGGGDLLEGSQEFRQQCTGLGFSCSRRRCRVPRTGSPGPPSRLRPPAEGTLPTTHRAAEAGLWEPVWARSRASPSPFLPLRPWAKSLPLSRSQCPHLCRGQRAVSIGEGGGERCPRLWPCSALRHPSPRRRLRAHLQQAV